MSNIYFMCENCGIETNGITFVNGMKFCAKCYHQIFGKDNQQTEIDQLKQQLEEYKNKENTSAVNSWDEMLKNCENCGLNECIGCEYTQTCVQNIKQQLAEKDKEIERLKNLFELNNEVVINQGKEIFDLRVQVLQQKQNQTQLALQELEKVKNFVDGRTYCANYIKKRIKELKGEKDEV